MSNRLDRHPIGELRSSRRNLCFLDFDSSAALDSDIEEFIERACLCGLFFCLSARQGDPCAYSSTYQKRASCNQTSFQPAGSGISGWEDLLGASKMVPFVPSGEDGARSVPMVAALTKLAAILGPFEISADRH